MSEIDFAPAHEIASRIRRREIGCRELLEHMLARVDRHNPTLNAIVVFDIERARRDADAADVALARGEAAGPLHGLPMTVKESFDVEGLPTTWGVADYKGHRAEKDALAVERFRRAGAVIFGKTNVPVLLADWQTFNPIYGTTNNPWDTSRVPGGSSGGAAAALAAGLTALEAGSDIGASIRNPAHYCGVFGHKPTWGICSPKGHALGGRVSVTDISAIGPLARSGRDLEMALDVMAGPDEIDGAGWQLVLPPEPRGRLKDFKIAVMLTDEQSEVDAAVQERLTALAQFLAREGATVDDVVRPRLASAEVMDVYIALLRAATSARLPPEQFERHRHLADTLPADDKSYVARTARGNTMRHKDWLALNERRHQMRLAWAGFFEQWDLLLCPAAASAAFPHDHEGERHERTIEVNGRRVPSTDQLFWAGYSGVAYLPSTVAPIGRTPSGLPVGVQIVGPQYHDRRCLRFAQLLEEVGFGYEAPPAFA
jgi:amidase